ncbi:unnamed protein product [Thelazia callipaeda]|uniref:Homeobox domain-containing protein n=1 Tax=Thelazia callipaeda TaxID=103827 RepID=A0A0N5CZ02_THECL|nr:unnamed protein product [Thelazia callipaeda]
MAVWFQNARAKFRRNSIQCHEISNDSHIPALPHPSTSYNETITSGDSVEESWRTSASPDDCSQQDEHSYSSNDDNKDNSNGKHETEASACISSTVKTLFEYFETDPTIL